ncbi:MAG: GGDEF domain-containing protein [candidate division Zixibacteria bacterium]|nr:GGDEF domain-containing protein [candidate division Zixibacteria bacterium]
MKAAANGPALLVPPPTVRLTHPSKNCIALYDEVGNATGLVLGVPGWQDTIVFKFQKMDDLFKITHRHKLDFILISVDKSLNEAIKLVRQIESQLSLATAPSIIYQKNPTREQIKQGLASSADDYIWGEWDGEIFQLRVKMIRERTQRDIGVNPTSQLPGPILIEQEINHRLATHQEFAVCYLDIDNFKAYNDYRGYVYGDRTIRLVAHIIRDVVADLSPASFVGHIGGDDFMFLLPVAHVDPVCSNIVKIYDRIIPSRYEEDDRNRGQIVSVNRRGEREVYPLMTISIAVLIANSTFTHLGEMSHMLADLKSYIKSLSGSNYVIERRKKY